MPAKETALPRALSTNPCPISDAELDAYGIFTQHSRMENGELRFRLCAQDGSSYIRCENPGAAVWENSHSHSALQELVLVQSGSVVFAEYRDGTAEFRVLCAGEFTVTTPGVPHNECVGAGAAVHTVKFGDCARPDWLPCPALDALTKPLGFEEAFSLALKGLAQNG